MSDLPKPNQCPACNSTAIDNYCSNCGQKIYNKRFTVKGIFAVVGNALNLERGFLYTMVWMFRNPGKVIDDYLNGKTKPYINPLNFILIIGGAFAFLVLSLGIFDTSIETSNQLLENNQRAVSAEALEFQKRWIEFIRKYINLIPLILIPFASIFSKWYYRKKKLYYGEHLILNSFVFGQYIVISIILALTTIIIPGLLAIFPLVSACLTAVYFTYAYYRYFRGSVINAFFGAIVMYLGGFILLMILVMIVIIIWIIIMASLGINPFEAAG